MNPLCVILGGGGHARVLIDCLRAGPAIRIYAVLDSDASQWGGDLAGIPILGGDALLGKVAAQGVNSFIVGLGGVGDNRPRRRLFELGLSYHLQPWTVIHPTAILSPGAQFGPGDQLLPGCIVNTGAVLGANVIVNSGAIIEHDCQIGDHVHVATGARLAGMVRVGVGAHIGAGATIRQGIEIGAGAIVGAGAVVVKDVPALTTVVGVPARPLHQAGQENGQ